MGVGAGSNLDWEVIGFCNKASKLGKTIIFVVDEANVLDADPNSEDRISNEKKMEVRDLLDGIAAMHLKIASSTANYLAARHDQFRDTSESRLSLYNGLEDEVLALRPQVTNAIESLVGNGNWDPT